MENKGRVSDFYNKYMSHQIANSYNDRHLLMNKFLIKLGLNKNSSVLELGCGIGVITSLMIKTVKKGKIVSVDISDESIKFAKDKIKESNVDFIISDLVNFDYPTTNFDFVTLFDVLEHIPIEHHCAIFRKIVQYMDNNSKLIIHVPTKEIIYYNEKNCPELMQIIDQPLSEVQLIKDATDAGLRLESFDLTNIWNKGDYQLLIFTLPFEYQPNNLG